MIRVFFPDTIYFPKTLLQNVLENFFLENKFLVVKNRGWKKKLENVRNIKAFEICSHILVMEQNMCCIISLKILIAL